ncbi:MAG: ABC transporter ATP-binding protein [Oscillospiraceae bacterium]
MNALELQHLNKTYNGFQLHDLNLTLPSGCIMGLIGENGAGKSTTIRLILNMIQRDSGTITVLGKDNREAFEITKQDIGVVVDEVGFPECLTAEQINKIMRSTYQNWDEKRYFDYLKQLSVPCKKAFKEFSRGMKMKLGIAVALSHDAKLLILDEATSGLDPVVREEVITLFSEFTRDERHAVLISSHIVSDLEKICDYIAFLHKGELLLCEEKDRLLERYGIIQCTHAQMQELDPDAIVSTHVSDYNAEAIVDRNQIPTGFRVNPIGIEELFVSMIKGAR